MSYLIASHRPSKDGSMPIPRREDGEPFTWGMVYSQQTRIIWCEDVEEMVTALCGNPDYMKMTEQDKLVERIKVAIRSQVALQARLNWIAQQNGDWEKCAPFEREILNGSRFEQPRGWSVGSPWGDSHWTAPVSLVVVSTGFYSGSVAEVPSGDSGALLWLVPDTSEDLLDSMQDWSLCNVFRRSE